MKRLLYVIAVLLFVLQYSNMYAQTEQPEVRVSVCVGEERLENLLTDSQKDSVTHLTITGTMAEEDYAFIRCNRLKRIEELNFRDADIDTIPPHAFDFKWVSSSDEFDRVIILPLSLKHIDTYGLCIKDTRCKILLTGMFPSLGENAFRSRAYYDYGECGELLPSSDNEFLKSNSGYLTSVNDSVLYYCDAFSYGYVPDGVHVIYGNVFEHVNTMEITLPEEVDSIGNRAFANIHWYTVCGSGPGYGENYIRLKSLTPPKLGTDVFLNFGFYHAIYVPEESFGIYKNTDGWKDLYLKPYEEKQSGIEQLQVGNSCLSVFDDNGGFMLKSSKMICSIKCYNLKGQIKHNMSVYDNEVHLNKNIINEVSVLLVRYEDGTDETMKIKP